MNKVVTADQIHAQARGESASQATVIEQSRAIAEVQGALIVAQQRPRDETMALTRIREAGKQLALAEVAFFKFPRGGQTVSGESIHLAVEMARCWGNIVYGIVELSRADAKSESEMMAFAWDLETNTRSQMGFIVPHRRDTQQGPKALVDMRDIYENNANMGARRLRECIFRVLPTHVREIGKATCLETLQKGESEKPLNLRFAELLEHAEKLGISRGRIEAKLGPVAGLTAVDAANLHVSLRSIKRGEVSADEEFPRVGHEEATVAARQLAAETKPAAKPKPAPAQPRQDTATADNPAAAEGKPDEETGEAHSATESDEARARRLIDEIATKEMLIDLGNWQRESRADYDALPEELQLKVDEAIDAQRRRLEGGQA